MTRRLKVAVLLTLCVIGSGPSYVRAQGDDGNTLFFRNIGGSTLDRVVNPSLSVLGGDFEITASNENSNAKLRLSRTFSDMVSDKDEGYLTGRYQTWSLVFSAPLDKNDNNTDVATLDGLADAFTAAIRYTSFRYPGISQGVIGVIGPDSPACIEARKSYHRETGKTQDYCDSAFIEKYAPSYFQSTHQAVFRPAEIVRPSTWRTFWGFSGRVGYQVVDYRDLSSLAAESDQKAPWSVGGHVGTLLPIGNAAALVTLGYDYQEAYATNPDTTMCPQSASPGPVTCTTDSFGEPNKSYKSLGYLEVRGLLAGIGLSLRYTHDFNSGINGIDLPIYLFRNKSNALNGGLRFGYNDADDEFEAGIFVGSQFSLFGG